MCCACLRACLRACLCGSVRAHEAALCPARGVLFFPGDGVGERNWGHRSLPPAPIHNLPPPPVSPFTRPPAAAPSPSLQEVDVGKHNWGNYFLAAYKVGR